MKKAAAAFADKEFKATTGDMTGIVTMYKGAVQLAPRDMADVAGFATTTSPDEGGDEPDPDPTPDPNPNPDETVYFWQDDFSQFNSETGDSSADLGANLKGSVTGFTDAYQSVAKIYGAAAGKVKGGSSSVKGTLTTPAMKNVSGTAEAILSVDFYVFSAEERGCFMYNIKDFLSSEQSVCRVTEVFQSLIDRCAKDNGGTIEGAASVTTAQLTAEMKTYTFNLAGITSATTITIEAGAASKKRFYLDNLIIKQK